jgi:hypothetical protein
MCRSRFGATENLHASTELRTSNAAPTHTHRNAERFVRSPPTISAENLSMRKIARSAIRAPPNADTGCDRFWPTPDACGGRAERQHSLQIRRPPTPASHASCARSNRCAWPSQPTRANAPATRRCTTRFHASSSLGTARLESQVVEIAPAQVASNTAPTRAAPSARLRAPDLAANLRRTTHGHLTDRHRDLHAPF